MAITAAAMRGLFAEVRSRAEALSVFSSVNGHEPRNAPGSALTFAFWGEEIKAVTSSGLASTTCVIMLGGRIYHSALGKPEEDTDPAVMSAACSVMAACSAGFTLDGEVRDVDLLGQFGTPLSAHLAWLTQEGKQFRTAEMSIPLVVDDMFPQAA